jgi:pimeloyl-ACP methyl ester carboxylesterase
MCLPDVFTVARRSLRLSDREVQGLSLDTQLLDMQAVVEAAKLDRFVLYGASQGAAIAIEYAARHPERVRPADPWRVPAWGAQARSIACRRAGSGCDAEAGGTRVGARELGLQADIRNSVHP